MTGTDPPIRSDGLCYVCQSPRKLTGLRKLYQRSAESDPFCSTECARLFYGVSLPPTRAELRKLEAGLRDKTA